MSATTRESPVDVLIIGSGPAGLTTSLGLSRLLHTCIVFSSSKFRNDISKHMHGVVTWENRDPADFRAAAKKDILANYDTVSFQDAVISKVTKMAREDGSSLFQAIDEEGKEWWGRKVVLATGIKDIMSDIEGYEECWANTIFHCLFCHGYEERGAPSAGVLATDDSAPSHMALHLARFANRLASKITIYTNGNEAVTKGVQELLSKEKPNSKAAKNIVVESRKIAKFVKGTQKVEIEVVLEDGTKNVERFLAHKPKGQLNGDWVNQLGLETTEQGDIKVSPPFNETSVSGVFAAGDCGTVLKAVPLAIGMGSTIVAGLAMQLAGED